MATAKKNTTPNPVEALAQARALVAQREAEYVEAEERDAALPARLAAGDDSVTAAELTDAANGVRRAKLLLDAAREAIPAAERAVKLYEGRTNPVLAEYLRAVIEENRFHFGLFGVPVEVVPERPVNPAGPAAYLYQTEGTDFDYQTGRQTGIVNLMVVVPTEALGSVQAACGAAIYKFIRDAGHAEVRNSTVTHPDHFVLSVYLKHLEPLMPVIEERSTATGTGLAQQLGGLAAVRSKQWIDDPRTDRWANVHTVMYRKPSGEVVSQSRDGDTVRRTVRVQFTVHGINQNVDFPELSRFVAGAIEDASGIFSPGLGRVESAKVIRGEETKVGDGTVRRSGLIVTAELVLISKAAA
ncbi:hypothetical protein [Micromonospora sp. NPDC023737]|uniref:hypothetical protein n=1 Tax=unclassified Micromonospora TaxID=2617518 RepID=UPI0034094F2A